MNESILEKLLVIKSIAELMENQDSHCVVEFSPGVVNSLGRQIAENVDDIIASEK